MGTIRNHEVIDLDLRVIAAELKRDMADMVVDPNNKDSESLYKQGVRAYHLRDYNCAVQALSQALEVLVDKHKDDTHDSFGEVYKFYGKSLIELSRTEWLGDGIPQNVNQSEDEEDEQPGIQEGEDNSKNEGKEGVTAAGDSQIEQSVEKDLEMDVSEANEKTEQMEFSDNTDTSDDKDDEETSDLQLAWEVLEIAKKIFEKRGEAGKKDLAETLISLGEISLENEKYDDAIKDIQAGLNIQLPILEPTSRSLAETYYKLAVVYGSNSQITEACANFEKSIACLKSRIDFLNSLENKAPEVDYEIKEIEELILPIEEKINDIKSCKEEVKNLITEKAKGNEESKQVNGNAQKSPAGPSSDSINDISHLVKRRKKN